MHITVARERSHATQQIFECRAADGTVSTVHPAVHVVPKVAPGGMLTEAHSTAALYATGVKARLARRDSMPLLGEWSCKYELGRYVQC